MPAGAGLILGRGGGAPPFTPFDEPGMVAWWDSEHVASVIGGQAASLTDRSGNGNTATARSAGQRPVIVGSDAQYGGLPSLTTSNAGDTAVDAVVTYGAFTIVQVCRVTSTGTRVMASTIGDYVFSGTGYSMYTGPRSGGSQSSYDDAAGGSWAVSAAPRTLLRRMDGTHAGDTLRVNGVQEAQTSQLAGDPLTLAVSQTFTFMANASNGNASDGSWVTTLVYDHAVSGVVAAKIEAFFRAHYNHY